jgi:lysozyme family protein
MATENWTKSLEAILHHEGGYVNHPKDPGGMTNLGVTKRVYEEWVGYTVSENTMQNLTNEDVSPIYKKNYWDRVKGDQLPAGLDLCVFDFGVNAGTGRAAKYLQTLIGTVADGGIGPNTLKTLDAYVSKHGVKETIENYQAERQKYYESLSTFDTFGRGWTRRVTETTEMALSMI